MDKEVSRSLYKLSLVSTFLYCTFYSVFTPVSQCPFTVAFLLEQIYRDMKCSQTQYTCPTLPIDSFQQWNAFNSWHYSNCCVICFVILFQRWSVPFRCQLLSLLSILGSCLHHHVDLPTTSSAWGQCLSPVWQWTEDIHQVMQIYLSFSFYLLMLEHRWADKSCLNFIFLFFPMSCLLTWPDVYREYSSQAPMAD